MTRRHEPITTSLPASWPAVLTLVIRETDIWLALCGFVFRLPANVLR